MKKIINFQKWIFVLENQKFFKTENNWFERKNSKNDEIKKKHLPKIETMDQNFIYDIDKINRYSAIKKFEKDNKPPVNDYLHFKNDIIPTANF